MIPIKEYYLLEAPRYNLPLIQVPSGEYFSWEIIVIIATISISGDFYQSRT
ncbi:putative signal peptidase I-1 domain protein [Microcystis aeruginosa FACHB-905 = DIANCHI905]|jgi:hypothetical protein|nr:putative signal peptidase I-1 domain protein [Microcystis aeruginosa FACHB-905 = DIANCHI905]